MAESSTQDRQLPATARKIKAARKEGQVPRSQDLGHAAAVAAGLGLTALLAPLAWGWMQRSLAQGLRFDARSVQAPAAMGERLMQGAWDALWLCLPFGLVMMAVAVASSLGLGGWNFTTQVLGPNFGKLGPLQGLSRLVSPQGLLTALKACVLAVVLVVVGGTYLHAHWSTFAQIAGMELSQGLPQAGTLITQGLMWLLLVLVAFAMLDVPLQRYLMARQLKMSVQELKQEVKEQEGQAEVKQKMKARMRDLSRRRMLAAVPLADMVVMNPSHYAVALKYDEKRMNAPRVVAKGADLLALKIRDLAVDARVPVLQAPVLARALYAHAELDRDIPAALFAAVAQVLAFIYQLKAAAGGAASSTFAKPLVPPMELPVPLELDPHAAAAHAAPEGA